MEFWNFINKILILIRLLSQNWPTAPPSQISGYATALNHNFYDKKSEFYDSFNVEI